MLRAADEDMAKAEKPPVVHDTADLVPTSGYAKGRSLGVGYSWMFLNSHVVSIFLPSTEWQGSCFS